jgi:hypothetical protein
MSALPATSRGAGERRLYTAAALVAALVVFAGFARTYYLKGAFGTPALSPILHAHGLAMTLWVVLFIAQTRLVAAGRTDLHRKLGVAGVFVALLVIVLGALVAIDGARGGLSPGLPPLVFLAVPLGMLVVFAALLLAAIALRRRSDWHKRLMLLATLSLLTPALARLAVDGFGIKSPPIFFALTDVIVLAWVAWDTVRNRRLHPAFLWGTLFLFASQPLRIAIAHTAAWQQFAAWLTG